MSDDRHSADLEALRCLKARYCRLLDANDGDGWRELFTVDCVGDTSQAGWRISSSRQTRLRADIVTPLVSLYVSDGLRQRMTALARRKGL